MSELREGANVTQELLNPVNPPPALDNSPSLAKAAPMGSRNVLKAATTDASLESSGVSKSSHRPPVVHVTKYGERIDSYNRCDSGFLNYKLEQAA